MNYLFKQFDETAYLKSNPDVFEAVQNGAFSSAWEHYLAHGFQEKRPGVSSEIYEAVKDFMEEDAALPFPPEHLRKRVHGDEALSGFKYIGRKAALDIYSVAETLLGSGGQQRILDFGCGCGRVIRHFHKLLPEDSLYGTDIDEEAISWCQEHLAQVGQFTTNGELPPLPFENDFFDCVYSISVFTHLPEDMQFAWLEELRRISRPGTYLILTVLGEDLFQTAPEEGEIQRREKGFYYSTDPETEGLPDFYKITLHTDEYIHKHWSKFFKIEKIIKKGLANHQDLVLCKKTGV